MAGMALAPLRPQKVTWAQLRAQQATCHEGPRWAQMGLLDGPLVSLLSAHFHLSTFDSPLIFFWLSLAVSCLAVYADVGAERCTVVI